MRRFVHGVGAGLRTALVFGQGRTMRPSSSSWSRRSAVLVVMTVILGPLLAGTASADETDPVGQWPLLPEPEVVRDFDPPSNPYGPGHRGADLLGRGGQPVRAPLPGTITFAGSLAGRGVVVVDHGATRTTYEPVDAGPSVGDRVDSGDVLGRLQVPGSHCFPRACLHWGWLEGEVYLDPLRLVGLGPVRLLPLWRDSPVGASFGAASPDGLGSGPGVGLLVGAA